jgi:hypothetical protein
MSWARLTTLILGLLALGSCADSRPPSGSSETHFLLRCDDDSCGAGLECLCGACTKPCTADSSCRSLGETARCAASVGACDEAETCDVECQNNADCEALGSAHRCEQGRCRAPAIASGTPPPTPTTTPPANPDPGLAYGPCVDNPSCGEGSGLASQSSDGTCFCTVFCEQDGDCPQPATGTVRPRCIHDDLVINGMSGECELPCALGDRCPDGSACNGGGCRFDSGSSAVDGGVSSVPRPATTPIVDDPPPCDPGSCLFDGVCYPNGTTSEDGCCTCNESGGSCIEPAWCPGWVWIGKRCATNEDCDAPRSGLECRSDFFGERGVCTRDCGFGCPTGTECLAEVPDYNGGTINNVCMRFCSSADVCDQQVRGQPLNSECDRPENLTRSYCF